MVVYSEKSDREVWKSFKEGDELAFNFIYRQHVDSLYNYGYQVCKDQEFVRDCIQSFFISLFKRRKKLADVQSIKGYLFIIFQRELFKSLKNQNRTIFTSIENEAGLFSIESSHETKMITRELNEERRSELENALNKLPAKQRQAILLLYKENLSYKEIAELLNFKEVKTARTLVYRALKNLKELFK